jgi:alpha-mannosidase
VERPEGIEHAAQNWVDLSDGTRGIALLNAGMPGNVMTEGTMMLSLLRSHNLGAYGFGGGYEPGMSSETGFEIGQKRTFHYSLVPHQGGWRDAHIYLSAQSFNHPLLAVKTTSHPGRLAGRNGLIIRSHPDTVITSVRSDTGGTVFVRLYEASGSAVKGAHVWMSGIQSASEVDLLERPRAPLPLRDRQLALDFRPFEIKTIAIRLKAPGK